MKIGIVGTGAVGGYYGGHLVKAGNHVVFFARGGNLSYFQENGLTIESEVEHFHVQSTFTDDYQLFSTVDLLLFCVKSTATNEVADKLLPVLKEDCLILTLQNGVDNEEILASRFGKNRILSAAAYIQAVVKETGVIKQIGVPPRLVIGALDENLADKVEEISSLFNGANTETFTSKNIIEMKWKKLLWNVTFNPLTALVESKVGAIFENEGLYTTAKTICKEAIAVARAAGLDIDESFAEVVFKQGQFARNHHTSMLQDKLSGRAMELESICGYIVKKAKQLEVDIPVLETIYHLLNYEDQKLRQH
ncbi:ketopantoate reductase family protein [Neobacillus sp. K501]